MKKSNKTYIVMITDESYNDFRPQRAYGIFNGLQEVKEWLKDKFHNGSYSIDVHLLHTNKNEV